MEQVLFKLDPAPTFWAPVEFNVAGGMVAKIEVEFAYHNRDEFEALSEAILDEKDADWLPRIMRNWKGPDAAYSADTLARLLRNYPGSGVAIAATFRNEIFGAPRKN